MVQEMNDLPLYKYQERAKQHILKYPRSALFAGCGLGKSRITIEALKEMEGSTIIMAPKRVIDHTWPEELEKWWPEATYVHLTGTPKARAAALDKPADIYLINFELVAKLVDTIGKGGWRWPTVIIDESSRVKNRGTKLFKALRKVAGRWEHLVLLTGTPAPQGLEDLWSQIYLLDRGDRLGKTLTAFRSRWFDADYMGWSYEPKAHAHKEIEVRCSDLCLSMTAEDYLDLPEKLVVDVPVDLPPKALKQYHTLKKELVLEVQDSEVTALTAATLTNKLLQLTSGMVYDEEGNSVHSHGAKLEALEDILLSIGDESCLVVYQYRHELDRLRFKFPELIEVRDNPSTIDDWNRGKIKLLAVHPASAGHGLNLQHGGRHLVWTTPTWNLEHYIQTNARLHRNGQTKPVMIYRLLVAGTVDDKVAAAIEGKAKVQDILMESLK